MLIAFAIHELEERNILRWYERDYVDLPPFSNKAVRTWIVFVVLVGIAWCAAARLFRHEQTGTETFHE